MSGRTPGFEIDGVQKIKNALNSTRSQLDSKDIEEWKTHTSRTIITRDVVRTIRNQIHPMRSNDNKEKSAPEMVTNAWCKMYEILRACQFFNVNDFRDKEVRTGKNII